MEIKTFEQIHEEMESTYKDFHWGVNGYDCAKKSAFKFVEQFIDLASETGQKATIKSNYNAISEDILKIKELIK